MRVAQEQVELFMEEKCGIKRPGAPTLIPFEQSVNRHKWGQEELNEYLTACAEKNLAGIADALGDQLYILLGTANQHGIDLRPVFDEIHRSNMTKDPMDPVTGKGGKGANYEPPRLAEILLIQMTRLADVVR